MVVMDFPLESIHNKALKAAEATRCAQDQGKYWEMHDRLFSNQQALEPWKAHAEAIGLDVAKFEDCMTTGKHAPTVRKGIAQATKAGLTGTPAYVLGLTDSKDPSKVKGLSFLSGAKPFDAFKAEIEKGLAGLSPEPPAAPASK
jgi:protein-disulfide isomerase